LTKYATPAEEIRALLDQLHGEVQTREQVTRYRSVRRSSTKIVPVLDLATHTTKAPGLLAQLGVVAATSRPGVVVPGAAVPGGSPGWDADGALSPIVRGGKPDAAEPITDGWHVAQQIRGDLRELGKALVERGWKPGDDTLVSIALANDRTGRWIAGRLQSMVRRARVAASYDAPAKPLRDVYCPECGGEMRVSEDASSGVWCAGTWPVEGPAERGERWPVTERCGATWPRGAWVQLLDEATREAS
jgi:hypothetical protein